MTGLDLLGDALPVAARARRRVTQRRAPTPAQLRVLQKAARFASVRRSDRRRPDDDRLEAGILVDRCIAAGWLRPGLGWNSYILTSAGGRFAYGLGTPEVASLPPAAPEGKPPAGRKAQPSGASLP